MRIVAFLMFFVAAAAFTWLFKSQDYSLSSPVPQIFGQREEQTINEWFPKDKKSQKGELLPLTAKSAIAVDFQTGEIIFEKNSKARLPAASTVKIMTAAIALDQANLSDAFIVSKKAGEVGENSMGLTEGEELTLEELLFGMMLVSGNDAAVTIAEGVEGSEEAFVELMNTKAKDLGLNDTKFINASGLDVDGASQYTTARDMTTIAHFAWENYENLRKITSTYHKFIDADDTHKVYELYNDTNLLTTYPGVRGIKPGFTWEAGWCLVTYAENDGRQILAVILGSENRREEMKELLDYSFGYFGIKIDHTAPN